VAGLKENLGHDVGQTPTRGGVKRKSRFRRETNMNMWRG
jgi:hypothetical protein